MRTACCILVAALCLGRSPAALAEGPAAPPFKYRAPGACPTAETFAERLRLRLGGVQPHPTAGRALDVRIVEAGGRYVGTLSIIDAGGRAATKTLEDPSCAALVDALALVTALAVETDATDGAGQPTTDAHAPQAPPTLAATDGSSAATAPASRASAPPPTPAAAPAPTPTAAPAPASPPAPPVIPAPAASAISPAPGAPSSDQATLPAPPGTAAATGSRIGVTLGGLAALGPTPNALFGGELSLRWEASGAGVFAPAFELGATASRALDATEPNGTASFAWFTGRGAAYLLRWSPAARAVLRAGVAGDVGVLQARGSATTSPASSSRLWASLGAAVAFEVPLGRAIALLTAVGIGAPLRRDRYAFGSADFYQVPYVVGTGSLSIVAYVR
jgi:hypothetical protein